VSETSKPQTPYVSVVVPFYDEGESAADLVRELRSVLGGLERAYELILVDDGSRDNTWDALRAGAEGDPRSTVLRLRTNSGQTAALAAGIDRSVGEVIVILDGDGQNDPADIPKLLGEIDKGYDVVSGWRHKRKDAFFTRKVPSKIANGLIARISGVAVRDLGCSLKAYRRPYLEGIRLYGEMHRFLVIHSVWEGAKLIEVEVGHRPRTAGRSKYGLERTFKVVLDVLVMVFLRKYATKPIYLFGGFGLASIFCGAVAAAVSVGFKLAKVYQWAPPAYQKDFVETPLPLLVILFGLVGALSILLGLLAEMLTRTYHESQAKPVYSLAAPTPAGHGADAEQPSSEPPSVPTLKRQV
jgi:glycosyltransferase involved in cell wall biosynthesis